MSRVLLTLPFVMAAASLTGCGSDSAQDGPNPSKLSAYQVEYAKAYDSVCASVTLTDDERKQRFDADGLTDAQAVKKIRTGLNGFFTGFTRTYRLFVQTPVPEDLGEGVRAALKADYKVVRAMARQVKAELAIAKSKEDAATTMKNMLEFFDKYGTGNVLSLPLKYQNAAPYCKKLLDTGDRGTIS